MQKKEKTGRELTLGRGLGNGEKVVRGKEGPLNRGDLIHLREGKGGSEQDLR